MTEKSEPTILAEMLLDRLKEAYNILQEATTPSLLMEEITQSQYKQRFQAMSKEQRWGEINRLGLPGILAQLGIGR